MQNITVIGTGLMGYPMAVNLLKAGFSVTAWNRTYSKALPLTEKGAIVTEDLHMAVENADIVMTMLEDGTVVEKILLEDKLYSSTPEKTVFIDMSSIPTAMAKRHGDIITATGRYYLDAPVSGGTKGAAEGTLAIMAGGDQNVFASCAEFFNALGRATYVGQAGAGQLAKTANQMIVGNTIAAVSEAFILLQKGGADIRAVQQALKGGFADSRILQEHGTRMLERNFLPGGKVKTQIKDMDTALNIFDNFQLPITGLVLKLYQEMDEEGHGELDHASLLLKLMSLNDIQ